MSSSDEEYFDASPDVVLPSRASRRRANPSPKKVPNKNQREVLKSNFNFDLTENSDENSDSGDESEVISGEQWKRDKDKGNNQVRRSSGSASTATMERTRSSLTRSGGSGVENQPPRRGNSDVPDGDDEQSREESSGTARTRKRLSIRSSGGDSSRRSVVSTTSTAESLTAPSDVQNIYKTCSQMFITNKINPQNAFNLRLLDCINQMINSPTYDKSNMQLTSSTVEIGTKIYVCRVENTHSQVLSLASDITRQQVRRTNDRPDENQGSDVEMAEDFNDDEGGPRQKQKKKATKKRGKFVESDNAKLLTGLEEQNVKFVTRRNFLQKKFNEMIHDDLDFDYQSYFLKPEEEHPLRMEDEKQKLKSPLTIADGYANAHEMSRLEFLPFSYVSKFDPEVHDIWGRPLNANEKFRDQDSLGPQLPMNADFAYDPADRPAEYPEEVVPDNPFNHDFDGDDDPHLGEDDGGGVQDRDLDLPQVSFQDIRSLDDLEEYFQRVRTMLKDSKSKYGWCGPNFIRPKSTWPVNQNAAKKAKVRKEPKRFDFEKIDWSDKANKFNVNNQSARTIYDDKIIESWSSRKVIIPFLGVELTSYDDEFDPLDLENENDAKYVPSIFKLFTSRNRSILELLKSRGRRQSGVSDAPPNHDIDDDFDHEIELPRDIVEDFCGSQPANDEGFAAYGSTPAEGEGDAWQFPGSLPGLLNDDPLSLASEVDSIRFSRKPKPIDMSNLKKSILRTLIEKLDLDDTGKPLKDGETKIDLAELMYCVLQKIGERTEKLMSVPIFIVALMHVVADKKLFVVYDDSDPDCPVVVCRGAKFDHAKHIPMPDGGFDSD